MKKLKYITNLIQENKNGKLEGGFEIILSSVNNTFIIGGEIVNNCNGGNCPTGCGYGNFVPGCGLI